MSLVKISNYDNCFFIEHDNVTINDVNETEHVKAVIYNLSLNENFKKYNFIFHCSNKNDLVESTYIKLSNKILFIWGDTLGRIPLYEVLANHLYVFKAHMSDGNSLKKNLFPYPLGIPKNIQQYDIININNRTINVFFSGNLNKNRRGFLSKLVMKDKKLWIISLLLFVPKLGEMIKFFLLCKYFGKLDYLIDASIIRFTNSFQSGFKPCEYSRILSQSKIVLSPKGFDDAECFRFYEALRQGCIVITEKLPKHDFYSDDSYIEIDNWKSVMPLIHALLKDPARMKTLSQKALDYYNRSLSPHGVSDYIWKKINLGNNI
ncbi:hypothetical protein [Phocaeicola sp.]